MWCRCQFANTSASIIYSGLLQSGRLRWDNVKSCWSNITQIALPVLVILVAILIGKGLLDKLGTVFVWIAPEIWVCSTVEGSISRIAFWCRKSWSFGLADVWNQPSDLGYILLIVLVCEWENTLTPSWTKQVAIVAPRIWNSIRSLFSISLRSSCGFGHCSDVQFLGTKYIAWIFSAWKKKNSFVLSIFCYFLWNRHLT